MTNNLYLINPPNPTKAKGFPGSLLALDAWVTQNCPGTKSAILDEENTSFQKLRESLSGKLADAPANPFFGITCTTATYQDALEVARVLKEIRPESKVILGGAHISGQEEVILKNHAQIDFVVTGEGEKALQGILEGRRNVTGVTNRLQSMLRLLDDKKAKSGTRLNTEELGSVDVTKYRHVPSSNNGEVLLPTARGCPMGCSFCATSDEKVTAQDPDLVVKQIRHIVESHAKDGKPVMISIQDNFFGQNAGRAREVATKIIGYREESGADFEWSIQTRVEQFTDKSMASLMAKAGCTVAHFGVENFDPRMLDVLNKAANATNYVSQTRSAVMNCLENGINPHISIQVGIPGEDRRTEEMNEAALKQIGAGLERYGKRLVVVPALTVVYPGTRMHRDMINGGVPAEIYETFTQWERKNPKYEKIFGGYFENGNGGIPIGIMRMESLRNGAIEIDTDRLDGAKRYIDRIRNIQGTELRDYTNLRRVDTAVAANRIQNKVKV